MPVISGVDRFHSPRGRRAKVAREWFAHHGPPDLPPLPLGYAERERLKRGGVTHILAWYARSLACQNYDILKHPSFDDYARGVMCSEFAPDFIKNDMELKKRFRPCPLVGLGPGLHWLTPKKYARAMKDLRRHKESRVRGVPPDESVRQADEMPAKKIAAIFSGSGAAGTRVCRVPPLGEAYARTRVASDQSARP